MVTLVASIGVPRASLGPSWCGGDLGELLAAEFDLCSYNWVYWFIRNISNSPQDIYMYVCISIRTNMPRVLGVPWELVRRGDRLGRPPP